MPSDYLCFRCIPSTAKFSLPVHCAVCCADVCSCAGRALLHVPGLQALRHTSASARVRLSGVCVCSHRGDQLKHASSHSQVIHLDHSWQPEYEAEREDKQILGTLSAMSNDLVSLSLVLRGLKGARARCVGAACPMHVYG